MRSPGPALTRCLRPPLQKVPGGSSSLSFPPAREHHACRRQQLLEASCLHFPARVSGRIQHPRGEGTQPRKSLTAPPHPSSVVCPSHPAPEVPQALPRVSLIHVPAPTQSISGLHAGACLPLTPVPLPAPACGARCPPLRGPPPPREEAPPTARCRRETSPLAREIYGGSEILFAPLPSRGRGEMGPERRPGRSWRKRPPGRRLVKSHRGRLSACFRR